MPIRPENRDRYPKDWPAISNAVKVAAGWKCEDCGVQHGERGGRDQAGRWHKAEPTGTNGLRLTWPLEGDYGWCDGHDRQLRIVRIVLTTAHLNHEPEDCRPENLKAWCQRCHNRYDAKHRAAGIKARAKALRAADDLFPPSPEP